jgi:hypothetical protein
MTEETEKSENEQPRGPNGASGFDADGILYGPDGSVIAWDAGSKSPKVLALVKATKAANRIQRRLQKAKDAADLQAARAIIAAQQAEQKGEAAPGGGAEIDYSEFDDGQRARLSAEKAKATRAANEAEKIAQAKALQQTDPNIIDEHELAAYRERRNVQKKSAETGQTNEFVDDYSLGKVSYNAMRQRYAYIETFGDAIVDLYGTDSEPLSLRTQKAFRLKFSNAWRHKPLKTPDGKVLIPGETFADAWMQDDQRPEYVSVGFYRLGQEPPRHYNLFNGYLVTPAEGGWPTIKTWLLEDICADDQDDYEELLMIIRFRVVKIEVNPEIAIALLGLSGTGKTTLAEFFEGLFGEKLVVILDDPDIMSNRYNGQEAHKLVVAYDEATHSGDPRHKQKIKGKITSKRARIEEKYVKAEQIKNNKLHLIFTDQLAGVAIDFYDRRQAIRRTSEAHKDDKAYWRRLREAFKGDEMRAFLHDALAAELPERLPDPRKNAARDEVVALTRPAIQEFILEILHEGRLPKEVGVFPVEAKGEACKRGKNPWPQGYVGFRIAQLYRAFLDFMKNNYPSEKHVPTAAALRAELKRMLGPNYINSDSPQFPENLPTTVKPKEWVYDDRDKSGGWTGGGHTPIKYSGLAALGACRKFYDKNAGVQIWRTRFNAAGGQVVWDAEAGKDVIVTEEEPPF